MESKRGQGLSTNAIILIVLGVVVLVILIVGFTMGWDKIAPWVKQSNNVQTIVNACEMACSAQSKYDFCSFNKTLVAEDLPGGISEKEETCNFFSNYSANLDYQKYGIESCSGLC